MPKIIELTFELNIDRVSCPGVWLCQDGRVSLTVFALGTSYQTCLLPPIFPLNYKDVFYFRKRFQESCTLSNICCLLKEETIYCELVQWCEDCCSDDCTVLAQYLGALNDVLFPPNVCSSDGVDLLMRRSKDFPGILSPKIEISTKVRIDEVWNQPCELPPRPPKIKACSCPRAADSDLARQKQVCHTPMYHRVRCTTRPRSHSGDSRSCCSLVTREPDFNCVPKSREVDEPAEDPTQKPILESRYIDQSPCYHENLRPRRRRNRVRISPCVCEICKRYHELFHSRQSFV
ncbi:spermatogenesis associated 6-like protein [Pectinophora gossypiella]|uniref:spermatogenesis associated 6-like protein n=1 Tax=Pectinophora gossypiella TaxID=13191 RepID=UPI00214EAC26|nr:spermatogenesis associated 6-like protein [Pectinophora gossypiella]